MDSKTDKTTEFVHNLVDEVVKLLVANLPVMRGLLSEVIDIVFVPKVIGKQLALAVALQCGMVTIEQVWNLLRGMAFHVMSSRSRLISQLKAEQNSVGTQNEWMDLAEKIDNIQGNDVWRSNPDCPLYERDRIASRIDEYVHLIRRQDVFELMFTLRGGIHRNTFGLLHKDLFSKALAGSKVLVETYHNVVCAALDFCADAPVLEGDDPIPTGARLAFFNETRHAYGRTALLLSGGAALGFYHVGVVKCLMENGLMPRVMGGSSAGSILCAMIATRTDEECAQDLFHVKGTVAPGHSGILRTDFFRPMPSSWGNKTSERRASGNDNVFENSAGGFRDLKRTWQIFAPIGLRHFTSILFDVLTGHRRPRDVFNHDTDHFRECLRENVGNFTFQEAFDRTGRILNITVTPNNSSDPPRLLNYLTAPHVLVWSAAVASSSLPGVFESNKLMVKDADGTERFESTEHRSVHYSDGSMEADLPMAQLSEMFNVNHFIISQANPHAVAFASFSLSKTVWTTPLWGLLASTLSFLKNQTRAWTKHVVELVGGRRIAPQFDTRRGLWSTFFTQEYEGREGCDISLIPWISHRGFFSALAHCIYNPTDVEFLEWCHVAERETWKYIPAIKSHIAEEVTLDRCVQRLRKRVVMESWEENQRRQVNKNSNNNETLGARVPSFFTSPSLVNMGGLAIADQTSFSDLAQVVYDERRKHQPYPRPLSPTPAMPSKPQSQIFRELQNGWGGMGLRGNRSFASLNRTTSGASGLYLMDDDSAPDNSILQLSQSTKQEAGEMSEPLPIVGMMVTNLSSSSMKTLENHYVKTSSMANFYYRKTRGDDDDQKLQTKSLSFDGELLSTKKRDRRQRSQSAIELGINVIEADNV